MAQTNINIRMDQELKNQFDNICNQLGMNMTTAFTIFAKTMVREKRVPFELSLHVPNAETIAAIEETENIINGKIQAKTFKSVEELFEDLNA